jgi:hypothetical protein
LRYLVRAALYCGMIPNFVTKTCQDFLKSKVRVY